MKMGKSFLFHLCGFFTYSSSTLSQGIEICPKLYRKFWIRSCFGSNGSNPRKIMAIRRERTPPMLATTDIFMYFMVFLKVRRPFSTPATSTLRSFSSKIMSAMCFAIDAPESTDMPTFAASRANESLSPSPRNPTT
uniref:Secreted protein n=1 Tax=Opuntia streptacantha TaxID=393608 RepID=A0A7C8YVD3_OPUST